MQVGRIIWLGRENEKDLDSKASSGSGCAPCSKSVWHAGCIGRFMMLHASFTGADRSGEAGAQPRSCPARRKTVVALTAVHEHGPPPPPTTCTSSKKSLTPAYSRN